MVKWDDLNDFAENPPRPVVTSPITIEPFGVPRALPRLLFDFGVQMAYLSAAHPDLPILDFGSGTGWITEFLCRAGYRVVGLDVNPQAEEWLRDRLRVDQRLDPTAVRFACSDGHRMPFEAASFSNLLCYDTLHHMYDYPLVFSEFARILPPGGRAIFVEPGAKHSQSPDTIAFLNEQKKHDPTWIERDVVLEDIDAIARQAGFSGLTIVPMPLPNAALSYNLDHWTQFRDTEPTAARTQLRDQFCDHLGLINYDGRVIFYVDRQ